jgi:hypothetical protein
MRNVSDKRCEQNQDTHFMFDDFFPISQRLINNVEKCGRTREATNEIQGGSNMTGTNCDLFTHK